ncbi:MAG: hypothetical protein WC234_04655 [Endomicrobiaceae bacterium]
MKTFAFLFHPFDLPILFKKGIKEESIGSMNQRFVERTLRWLEPIKRESAVIKSVNGNEALCEMIMVPLICDQILNMDPKFVLDKTIKAAELAVKLKVSLIGLGAYLSPVGRRGVLISKAVNTPVTSGTTYTISTAIEATIKASESIGLNIENTKITIIGATGSIGKACANFFARKVNTLVLSARNIERLEKLKSELKNMQGVNAKIECNIDPKESVKNSDIVVISTSCPSEILSVFDLPAGCVVCDISVPHNITATDAEQTDVLVIDGGLVQVPSPVDFEYLALPPGVAYACLSEAMILALEGRFESFSCGGEISYEKIMEINALAKKHGFKLANFRSFGKIVDDVTIKRIRKARTKRK